MASRAQQTLIQKTALGGGAVGLLLLIAGAALAMMIGMVTTSAGLVYLSAAFLASAIPLMAGLTRGKDFDLFEPINLVAAAIFFGTTMRGIWLLTSADARVDFIMMGTTLEEVSRNCPAMLASICAFTIGYFLCRSRVPLERLPWAREYRISKSRLWFAISTFAFFSIIGIYLFMRDNGISLTGELLGQSMKRVIEFTNEDGDEFYGIGFARYMGMLSHHAFMLLSGLLIIGALKFRLNALAALGVLAVIAIAIPFLASSRSTLFLLALNVLILAHYYGRLKLSQLLLMLLIAVPTLAWLGELREQNQVRGYREEVSMAARIVGSGNSLDFVRTSAIMDRVPAVTGFEYGKTYLAVIAGPIPRNIWPDKPNVSLGGFVKARIFGETVRAGGWPSGMIAEGWLNFGYFGLIIPLFLFGAFLRIFYESFRPFLGTSFPFTILYAVSIWRIGFGAIGLNFAHGIMQALFYLAPMLVLLTMIRARPASGGRRPLVQPK